MRNLPFLACVLVLKLAVPLFGFDWPLQKVTITSTFAESRGDHFHSGIDLGGGEQSVLPIAEGELVFAREQSWSLSDLPVGLGNYVVLQHQGGVRSIYAHLKDGSVDPRRRLYDRGSPLGVVGSSGYSSGKHLHLSIIDSEMGTIINPLLLLPALPDGQPPVIRELSLSDGRQQITLRGKASVKAGPYELLAELFDLREEVSFLWKLAPYKVFLYQDGREVASLVFDSLQARRGPPAGLAGATGQRPEQPASRELALSGSGRTFRDLYAGPWLLRLGTLTLLPGETTLTVFVVDFAGNESSEEITLEVRSPR
jgi:hypothetical protein